MCRSNYSAPILLGHPRGHHFFGCPGLLITLFLPCPVLMNPFNCCIFQCHTPFSPHFSVPRPFLSNTFFLWPRGCPVEMGAKQFDRRISDFRFEKVLSRCFNPLSSTFSNSLLVFLKIRVRQGFLHVTYAMSTLSVFIPPALFNAIPSNFYANSNRTGFESKAKAY